MAHVLSYIEQINLSELKRFSTQYMIWYSFIHSYYVFVLVNNVSCIRLRYSFSLNSCTIQCSGNLKIYSILERFYFNLIIWVCFLYVNKVPIKGMLNTVVKKCCNLQLTFFSIISIKTMFVESKFQWTFSVSSAKYVIVGCWEINCFPQLILDSPVYLTAKVACNKQLFIART